MRAINHALTGAIIGLTIDVPVIALPAAFVSHYVLDAIPHHGSAIKNEDNLRSKNFTLSLYLDALLCGLVVLILAIVQPKNWFQAAVCAFLAALPDMFSFGRYWAARKHKAYKPNQYSQFASKIQWFERPIGGVVEMAWLIGATIIFVALLG